MAKLTKDYNFAALHPDIAKEWHPTKNGDLKPNSIYPKAHKKVWWLCEKGHEYEAKVFNRSIGRGCPYCSNRKVGYGNDLASNYPLLAKEWHPTKNGELKPDNIVFGSGKNVWWKCKKSHEWKAEIYNRTQNLSSCPYCSSGHISRPVIFVFCELKSIFENVYIEKKFKNLRVDLFIEELNLIIEYDGSYFHKNQHDFDKKKRDRIKKMGFNLINIRVEPLKKIYHNDLVIKQTSYPTYSLVNKIFNQILKLRIEEKYHNKIKSYLNNGKTKNKRLYEKMLLDLPDPIYQNSLEFKNPKIAKEWHPTKNGEFKPHLIPASIPKKFWWLCEKGHEYEATVNKRSQGRGCPYCSNRKVGYGNDLASNYPLLAKEWHPTKNGELKPNMLFPGSKRAIWWQCSKGHEWSRWLDNRVKNDHGCPHCKKK